MLGHGHGHRHDFDTRQQKQQVGCDCCLCLQRGKTATAAGSIRIHNGLNLYSADMVRVSYCLFAAHVMRALSLEGITLRGVNVLRKSLLSIHLRFEPQRYACRANTAHFNNPRGRFLSSAPAAYFLGRALRQLDYLQLARHSWDLINTAYTPTSTTCLLGTLVLPMHWRSPPSHKHPTIRWR